MMKRNPLFLKLFYSFIPAITLGVLTLTVVVNYSTQNFYQNLIKQQLNDRTSNIISWLNTIHLNDENIQNGLSKCPEKFDIIIDDSSHIFDHQIKIIKNSVFFLKDGAYLIIEDIFNNRKENSEKKYFKSLSSIKKYFSEIYFVQSKHVNNFSPLYDNDKILVLVRNDVN